VAAAAAGGAVAVEVVAVVVRCAANDVRRDGQLNVRGDNFFAITYNIAKGTEGTFYYLAPAHFLNICRICARS
jgi:hypothetical protein